MPPQAATQERQNGGKLGEPMELICWKCQKNSIPAPAGATYKTRFVCRECSPLGPDELRFDSSQFDEGMLPLSRYGPEARFKPDDLRIKIPPSDATEAVEVVQRRIFAGEDIALPATIKKVALNGDGQWTRAVNAKNLLLLPDRMLQAFLLYYWSEFSHAQIASEMHISEQVSKNFVDRARKRLAVAR